MGTIDIPSMLTPLPAQALGSDDAVQYRSGGRCLVVGADPIALPLARRLAAAQPVVLIAPSASVRQSPEDQEGLDLQIVNGSVLALQGWLGNFEVDLEINGTTDNAPRANLSGDCVFDLVFDFSPQPLLYRSVPPLGYFAPCGPEEIDHVIAMARALVGNFEKPRYFRYDSALCAHQAFGNTGCTRCLDVCGAEAVSSEGVRIRVEPHLCQGCAACTLACPTGALSFALPARAGLLRATRDAIADAGRPHPMLVVHTPEAEGMVHNLQGVATLAVKPLAAFGEELWLTALAMGANRVLLLDVPPMPAETRQLFDERLRVAEGMLLGMGYDEGAFALATDEPTLTALVEQPPCVFPDGVVGEPPTSGQKRLLFAQSLASLEPAVGFESIALPAGATLGRIEVDAQRCTLCSTCARLCPAAALRYVDRPRAQLLLFELSCVQCGICEKGCPEHAITLEPRLSPAAVRGAWYSLSEDDLATCSQCGTPFVSRKLLESLVRKAAGQLQLPAAELEQMRRCPGCRQHTPTQDL